MCFLGRRGRRGLDGSELDRCRSHRSPPRGVHHSRIEVLPTRNPKVIFKALATGAVLYSTDDEVYFGLNPVGVRVWELLPPAHQTLDEVCRVLVSEYPDAGEDVIRADVSELLDDLVKLGLLIPSQASAQHAS
jgi:hypothetical protein